MFVLYPVGCLWFPGGLCWSHAPPGQEGLRLGHIRRAERREVQQQQAVAETLLLEGENNFLTFVLGTLSNMYLPDPSQHKEVPSQGSSVYLPKAWG